LIDPRLVKQLALPEEGAASIIGITSLPIQVPLVSLSRVSMTQHLLKLFKAGIVDLTNFRIGIQLVLGINVFSGYRLQFDFSEGRLYLLR
jgi:DNA-binding transcriptional ArsR family regulator